MSLFKIIQRYIKNRFSSFRNIGLISLAVLLSVFFIPVTNLYAAHVRLVWEQNDEDDLSGYKVYYGKGSRDYNTTVDVGDNTNFNISGMIRNRTYYIAITAYDFAGNESTFSEEMILRFPAVGRGAASDFTTMQINLILSTNSSSSSVLPNAVDVSAVDQDNKPAPDILVKATSTGSGVVISPSTQITDTNGMARFKFRFKYTAEEGQIIFSSGSATATVTQVR